MPQSTDNLKTSDIKTAAFLLSKDVTLIRIDKSNPKKVIFYFEKSPLVKHHLNQYWSDKAKVNPRLLFDSLDRLKDAIHRDYEI